MAQACTVCRHPQRPEIERAIVNRIAYRKIAELFQTSLASLSRHKEHTPTELLGMGRGANPEENELTKATDQILAEVRGFQRRLKKSSQRNTPATLEMLLKISREIRALLELRSRMQGPRFSQQAGPRTSRPQEEVDPDAEEITPEQADQIAQKWLARRNSTSGKEPDVPETHTD